jgi:hypothetical protein
MMLTTHRKITHIFVFALALWLLSTCLAFSAHQAASHVAEPPDVTVGPTVVKVGIWVIDIDSIDSAAQSFVSNFFVKLSWQDKRLAHEDQSVRIFDLHDVWSPGLQIVNEIGRVRKTLPEIVQVKNDGTVIYRQRYVGSFSQPLQLQNFPFDEQLFRIHLVRTSKVDKLFEFTQDDELIAAGMVQAAGISKNISLPDWAVKSYTAGPLTYEITSSMKVSGYAFDFIAKRDSKYYIYKVIMPLVLIVMMSWAVFWINPKEAGTQIGISTASMLTLIAYRFTVDLLVPKVSYMTKLDEFILGSTFLVFLSLIQVIMTSSLMRHGRDGLSLKIDTLCRFLFPVLFAFVVIISFSTKR